MEHPTTQLDTNIVVAALSMYAEYWRNQTAGEAPTTTGSKLAEAAQRQLDLVAHWPVILRLDESEEATGPDELCTCEIGGYAQSPGNAGWTAHAADCPVRTSREVYTDDSY